MHVSSVEPGNSDAMVRTPSRVSAVNRQVANVPSRQRLSQNPRVFILTLAIATSVLML